MRKEITLKVEGNSTKSIGYVSNDSIRILDRRTLGNETRKNVVWLNFSELQELHQELGKLIEEIHVTEEYRKTTFIIDVDGYKNEGWTNDYNWNGHSCPKFEFDSAMNILNEYKRVSWMEEERRKSYYDNQTDTFYLWDGGDESFWESKGEYITVNGEEIKVYSIGAYWTWGEDEAEKLSV